MSHLNATETNSAEKLNNVWGHDNIPPGLSLEFEEKPIAELGIRKCRSFRADLVHKLNIICRAHDNSWEKTAEALGKRSCVLRAWRAFKSTPKSAGMFQRIDNLYEVSLERLQMNARRGRFGSPQPKDEIYARQPSHD